jgi:hypothetical protein
MLRLPRLLLVYCVVFLMLPTLLYAESQTIAGITITAPDTYSSCIDSQTSNIVTITGVNDRQLMGQVIVNFILDNGGTQTVPNGVYPINQTGDLNLNVVYPPVTQWPVLSNGTAAVHVDIQIEVYENGQMIADLGPGLDWGVFCRTEKLITPTATSTNTPTDTPTNTPTDTPTDTPTNTPTNTPTDTPTNTPTDTPTNTPTNTPTDTPTTTPTNTPPGTSSGNQGCTAVFWRQPANLAAWTPTGFTPSQALESVFDIPDAFGLNNDSLLQALNYNVSLNTTDTRGAAQALLVTAVSAVLNAAHPAVAYGSTPAQIITQVNAALATNDRLAMLLLALALEANNIRGCPLG